MRVEHGGIAQENEELKKLEEALPRLKEYEFEESAEIAHGKGVSRMRWLPPKSLP